MLRSRAGQPTPLKSKLWIKTETATTQPYQSLPPPPAHQPFHLFPLLHFRKRSGFSSAAQDQISLPAQNTGAPATASSLGCQDDASAVSKRGAQVRNPPGERQKAEHGHRGSLPRAASSCIPSTPSTALHAPRPHGARDGAGCAGRATGGKDETLLESQSSHLPRLADDRSQLAHEGAPCELPTATACFWFRSVPTAALKRNCSSPYAVPWLPGRHPAQAWDRQGKDR